MPWTQPQTSAYQALPCQTSTLTTLCVIHLPRHHNPAFSLCGEHNPPGHALTSEAPPENLHQAARFILSILPHPPSAPLLFSGKRRLASLTKSPTEEGPAGQADSGVNSEFITTCLCANEQVKPVARGESGIPSSFARSFSAKQHNLKRGTHWNLDKA